MKKNNKILKRLTAAVLCMGMLFTMGACGDKAEENTTAAGAATEKANGEKVTLTVLAAASLTDVCNELTAAYNAKYPNVELNFSFAGSGALQTQIEEGAPADVFISAANKQMNALKEKGLILEGSDSVLLENKVVLITPTDSQLNLTSFEDVKKDDVKMIGLGEVESVPAGQYAKKVFTSLNCWEEIEKKANFGADVRTVLAWVASGEVDCGVVYATDAYTSDQVKIVCEAPEGSTDKVVYPAAVVKSSANAEAAKSYLEFLASDEAMKVFEKYGFVKPAE